MPQVFNKRDKNIPKDAVYVGRPSIFGNPFVIGKDGNREEVCDKYKRWLYNRPDLIKQAIYQLKGKDLVCWCAPAQCHADTLLYIANKEPVIVSNAFIQQVNE